MTVNIGGGGAASGIQPGQESRRNISDSKAVASAGAGNQNTKSELEGTRPESPGDRAAIAEGRGRLINLAI